MSINLETAQKLIIERAGQLVKRLIDRRGHDVPPFLSEEFAKLIGVQRVEKTELGKTSGILIRLHEGSIIKINRSHNQARQNFSCAHEIAHMLYSELKLENYINTIEHRTYNPPAQQKARARARERLCDIAATELLMPEQVFIKHLSAFGTSIHSIERMADIFQVSIQSAARRVAEVSIEPCITIMWKLLPHTRMFLMVSCEGPGIRLTGKSSYMPVHTNIKYPSILHKAFEQDCPVKCYKSFKIGADVKRFPMESKGFGRGENRYVVSLAYPER